tara:strand:+ start:50035 stop:50322 length:288 start_codon:yes stop_codon:yes gene_type:complete
MAKKTIHSKVFLIILLLAWTFLGPLHLSNHNDGHNENPCNICFHLSQQSFDAVDACLAIPVSPIDPEYVCSYEVFLSSDQVATFHPLRGPPEKLT